MQTFKAFALAAALSAVPVLAQAPAIPGNVDVTRVVAGTYTADARHTQVGWSINHLGFSIYDGLFGGATGAMTIDPAKLAATTVAIEIPIEGVVTTVPALNDHIKSPDFLDAAKFPTAAFKSTRVTIKGTRATIVGDLTLHGVTKPITLDARFVGVGTNARAKKLTIGFAATGSIKRSDFGIVMLLPALGDTVDLTINAAFERPQ